MSRYCGEKQVARILEAAQHWRRVALESDGSVFSAASLWTLENLKALDIHFIQQPDAGEGNYFEKLEAQLAPTVPEVKKLAAEMLWMMLLCPSNVTASKKREGIATIWSWSGDDFPADSEWLVPEVLSGVGSAGTSYNTNRWREFVFFIRMMMAFKQLTRTERESLLSDGWRFAEWLQGIPECDSRQFRNMVLFLLFPDEFERIFGGGDRRRIVEAFAGIKARRLIAVEIDRKLAEIRQRFEQEYGTRELDFYIPPLRDLWDEKHHPVWWFVWDPQVWRWQTFSADRSVTHEGKTVTRRWPCENRRVATGDKAYLVKIGTPPRGVIAVGNVVADPYESPHWDEDRAAKGESCWYVDIAFSCIQDPTHNDPYVSEEDLAKNIRADGQEWLPESSGVEIHQRSAGILEKLWNSLILPEKPPEEVQNLILYGPTGTGKTWQLNRLIDRYSSKQRQPSRETWLMQEMLDARWFDVVFSALYLLGGRRKAGEIVKHELVQLKARALGRTRNLAQTVWATLQAHAREGSATVKYKARSEPQVFDKDESSAWHLVDDWRETCAEQIESAERWKRGPDRETPYDRYEFVTFHQAYSYEDFIEGIRPVQDQESGELGYQVLPGVFKRVCQRAKADPEQRYAIFIDEINRGNIAKIFGELITLIEADKRAVYASDGHLKEGMEVTLPYSGERFGVPRNVDIYGAMNTADRSIALLDTALRRRFRFHEIMPDSGVISGSWGDGYIEDGEGGVINLRAILDAMNRRIRFLLNRDLTLGHAYFIDVRDFVDLKGVLLSQIIPLLQEYFYEDWHRIQLVFRDVGPGNEKLEPQIIVHEILREEDILGFDHEDFEDLIEYRVAEPDEITPDAVRKIYEESS